MGALTYEPQIRPDTAEALGLDYAERVELFRRMVFNVYNREMDDHTKNFSFLMTECGHVRGNGARLREMAFSKDAARRQLKIMRGMFPNMPMVYSESGSSLSDDALRISTRVARAFQPPLANLPGR